MNKLFLALLTVFIPIIVSAIIIIDESPNGKKNYNDYKQVEAKQIPSNQKMTVTKSIPASNTVITNKVVKKTTTSSKQEKPIAPSKAPFSVTKSVYIEPIESPELLPRSWPWRGATFENSGTPEDVSKLAAMNVNAIAIQLNVRQIAESKHMTTEEAWADRLEWADTILAACKNNNIVCIIAIFQFPFDPNLGLKESSPDYWNNKALQYETIEYVAKLAEHFKDAGNELGAYDILSEPLVRFPLGIKQTPKEWHVVQDAIIRKIKQIDPKRYVIVTPGYGGMPSSFENFKPLNYPKLIYSAHMYSPHRFTHQGLPGFDYGKEYPSTFPSLNKGKLIGYMQPVIDFKQKYNALVYIGEFSAIRWASGGDQYVSDLIDIFDTNQLSWMYFSYGYHGWNPSYSTAYTPNDAVGEYKRQFKGDNTPRWQILKNAFKKNKSLIK